MLIEALRAEAADYVERHRGERDEHGHAWVVRNGRAQTRKLTLRTGTVEVNAPRVDNRRLDQYGAASASPAISCRPTCAAHPRSARCCRSCTCGLSTGDFPPGPRSALLGEGPAGLSPTNVARLTAGR